MKFNIIQKYFCRHNPKRDFAKTVISETRTGKITWRLVRSYVPANEPYFAETFSSSTGLTFTRSLYVGTGYHYHLAPANHSGSFMGNTYKLGKEGKTLYEVISESFFL